MLFAHYALFALPSSLQTDMHTHAHSVYCMYTHTHARTARVPVYFGCCCLLNYICFCQEAIRINIRLCDISVYFFFYLFLAFMMMSLFYIYFLLLFAFRSIRISRVCVCVLTLNLKRCCCFRVFFCI